MVRANDASDKEYNTLYSTFLKWLVLPEAYLKEQYSTRYARYFYSEIELTQFHQKWLKDEHALR